MSLDFFSYWKNIGYVVLPGILLRLPRLFKWRSFKAAFCLQREKETWKNCLSCCLSNASQSESWVAVLLLLTTLFSRLKNEYAKIASNHLQTLFPQNNKLRGQHPTTRRVKNKRSDSDIDCLTFSDVTVFDTEEK